MISDKDNCIIEVNSAFTQLTGYSLAEIKGKNPKFLSAGRTKRETYVSMWESIREKNFWQGELWDCTKDGRVYPKFITISVVRNAHNDIDFYIGSFTDISDRKAAEEHIAKLAQYDILTGLLNRFSLQNRMEQAIATAKREQHTLAVMFMDMDRFKLINDTLGHAAGDALLVEVARRLHESVRDSDIVARWGGDEFVIVLTEVENTSAAESVINKIVQALRAPYWYRENAMHSSPSIGVALFPDNGKDIDSLMRNADTALYHAKAQGRNNTQFFTPEMNESNMERLWLERDLQVALEKNQLEVYYQPQIDSRANRVIGFEALVRWHHPTEGLISPAKFIHIAEETGIILALGEWVLNESCRQLRLLRDQGFSDVRMAVNLSAHQLRAPTLLVSVALALQKYNLSGTDLELEVTESVAMRDPEASIGQLHALRIMGIKLAIDDFGTGYSSLSYLKLLPIHTLKLDQSFVSGIETDSNDTAICAATISLAHNLGLHVIAEGVETEAQRNFLAENKCDFLQGYLFSRPMPGPETQVFLKSFDGNS